MEPGVFSWSFRWRLHYLETENAALRQLLFEQWEFNHAEHCGKPWPHDGECYWPLPELLRESQ